MLNYLWSSNQNTYGAQTKLLKHAKEENANLFVEQKANYMINFLKETQNCKENGEKSNNSNFSSSLCS